MLPRFFAYDAPLPWEGESVAIDLRPLGALVVSVLVTTVATAVLFHRTRHRLLAVADDAAPCDAAPCDATPYRLPDRRHLGSLEDLAASPPPAPAPASPAHAVIAASTIALLLGASTLAALVGVVQRLIDPAEAPMGEIIWAAVPLALAQSAIVAVAGVRYAEAPSRRAIAPMAIVGAGVLVAVLGHAYAASLTVGAHELRPASTARVHAGKTREIEPVLMATYHSGFFSVTRSYEPLRAGDLRGWTPSRTRLEGDSPGFHTATLRASRPFLELRRSISYEVAEEPATTAFPIAVGSTWILDGDQRGADGAPPDRVVVTITGEHVENGLHVRDLLIGRSDPSRGARPLERMKIYAWKSDVYVLPAGWREKDELFFDGFVDGDCTIAAFPWYRCTCAARGKDQTIAGPTLCRSGDLAGGLEKAIVGVFTLGFGNTTRYHTLRIVRASPSLQKPSP